MNIHPVFQERIDHAIGLLHHSAGQTTSEILNRAADCPQDSNFLFPYTAFYLGLNYDGECINPDTRRPLDRNISDLSPAEAAHVLEDHAPTILDPAHLTAATSRHRICNHDLTAIAELIAHLDATAQRIITRGGPASPPYGGPLPTAPLWYNTASRSPPQSTKAGWTSYATNTVPKPDRVCDAYSNGSAPKATARNPVSQRRSRPSPAPTTVCTPTRLPYRSELPVAGAAGILASMTKARINRII